MYKSKICIRLPQIQIIALYKLKICTGRWLRRALYKLKICTARPLRGIDLYGRALQIGGEATFQNYSWWQSHLPLRAPEGTYSASPSGNRFVTHVPFGGRRSRWLCHQQTLRTRGCSCPNELVEKTAKRCRKNVEKILSNTVNWPHWPRWPHGRKKGRKNEELAPFAPLALQTRKLRTRALKP